MTRHVPRAGLTEIWRRYKSSGDRSSRDWLLLTYSPLVKYVAGRLGARLPQRVEARDLLIYGQLGLAGAIERFAPDGGIAFETWAAARGDPDPGPALDKLAATIANAA